MKIRFLLKRRGKKRGVTHPIFLALYDHDTTEIIYTGYRIGLNDWSKEDRLPLDHSSDLYTNIDEVKKAVEKVMKRMRADDKPVTPYQLKQEFERNKTAQRESQNEVDRKEKSSQTSIVSLIDKWIKTGLEEYLPSTRRTLVISINQFKEYLKISGRLRLERKELTSEIIHDYAIEYLQKKRKLSDSTHAKRMKHLRLFLKSAKIDTALLDIKIRTVKPDERNIIALTAAELEKLEAVDVSFDFELQRSKDMFLLGCYTGLRVSDLKRINKHRIENGEINITMQKNRKNVSIPILKHTDQILKRYEYSAPKISEQQVNTGIKEVCRLAEINRQTIYKKKKNGVLIESHHPKHALVTTHVAGKTFITLAADKWGFTPADIAAFVGKDIKTVLGYYLRPDQDSAKQKMLAVENRAKMKVS